MLQGKNLGRYRDLMLLLTRYGMKDFRLQLDPADPLPEGVDPEKSLEPDVKARAEAFAQRLKEMGPTYIKFGQLLSTRPDIVPPEYITSLEALQDQIEAFSYGEVESIVEAELKAKLSRIYIEFETTPIAAASIGQVHRAKLRDGREVVVKVQRPGVREVIRKDLEAFIDIATTLEQHSSLGRKMNLISSLEQLRRTLLSELDYLQEAAHGERLHHNLAEFEQIYIPTAIRDLTTSRILTTEFVHGKKISLLSSLALVDHDYKSLADVLTRAYLKQICVDGLWHSDPHPGNVFLRDGQIVLLDFGMVGRISGEFQDQVIKLLLGVTGNRGRDVAETCIRMGTVQPGFDREKFVAAISTMVTHYHDIDLRRANTGQLILQVVGIANVNELRVPSELALLAKTLLNLDGITRKLDPDFDPQSSIRAYAEELIVKKVRQRLAPRNYYGALLDLNQLIIDLPGRSRDIVDQLAGGKFGLHLQLDQADIFLKGMQRIANRITVGLVIAALLIASALMMRVPTRSLLFGYPVLAVTGYLIAAAMAVYLVISIFLRDRQDRRKTRER